jgi:TolB protein
MKVLVSTVLVLSLALVLSGCLPGSGEQQIVKIDPVWSPDGKNVAFSSNQEGKWSIYIIDLETDVVQRLTDGSANAVGPSWSPQGDRITFSSDRSSAWEIYIMKADGSEVRQLTGSK